MAYTADPSAPVSSQLSGYVWGDLIYQGAKTAVYHAVEIGTQQPVVIKYLCEEYPSFGELVQFRNQYTITQNLSIPGILRPLGLEPFGDGYALIMEDSGGVSLEQYAQQQPLSLIEAISTALQLADILHQLHQQRVIHKDIKPANILIHPESKRITLIDFSIASLLPKETPAIQSPKNLEGTLAYLAPEQTGRMNRGIDYRADFYALGVTLFQLLTGKLPFTSADPMALIHHHIAQLPIPVNQLNPEIPSMVAQLVAKLMAKNAEDRYQSALGLKHDLERCLIEWKEQGEITDFELGERDLCDRFLIPEKLYGREADVKTLLDAFDRVSEGASELMLVAGFSGIGKTAVINEVHKPIVRQRGYFIKGKFDQFNRNIPFSAFVQAFRSLVRQLLSESPTELQIWKSEILVALGQNAQVIIDLIPELERVLGPQPAAPDLSGAAAQNRFNLLFQKFIHVFTTPDHPLVIFVDDLQWADSASLALIQLLMADAQSGHLLLLGAYRDNEVFPGHPLMLTLDGMWKGQSAIHTLTLNPLDNDNLNHLIADTLHTPVEVMQPLTALVMQKTQGNPFFASQFLNVLHQDKLITFDADAGRWQCDIAQVQAAALTDDVVELMAAQLQKLSDDTQEILKLAACIGAQFDLGTLAIVFEKSPPEAANALWPAVQEGFVIPTSQVYKFFQTAETEQPAITEQPVLDESVQLTYRFLHDRVQQAAYALIPDEQKQQTHLQIGRLLWQETNEIENCFEILNHLNIGMGLIVEPQERRSLMQLNLTGCRRAKLATAYGAALQYADVAMGLLPAQPWSIEYDFVLALYEITSEVAYLNTDFNRSENLIQEILANTHQLIDSTKAYELLVQIYIAKDQQVKAIETGLEALTQLGVTLVERSDWQHDLPALPDATTLKTQPEMENPVYLASLRILISIIPPTHHVKPELFPSVVLTMLELCNREGLSDLAAYVYGIYGLFLCAVVNDPETAHRSGKLSLQLLEDFQADHLRTKVNMLFAVFVCAGKEAGQNTLPLLKQGIEVGFESGDIEYVSYCIMAYFSNLLLVGRPLSEVEDSRYLYMSALEQFKQEHCIEYSKLWLHLADALTDGGLTDKDVSADSTIAESNIVAHFEATHNHQCLFALHLSQLISCYTFGQYELALEHAAQAIASQEAAFGLLLTAAHHFYAALTLLAPLTTQAGEDSSQHQEILSQVATHCEKLVQLAAHAPSNYQHKVDLIMAEQHRVTAQISAAIDCYERAIVGAQAAGYVQEEALANELAAKFYLDWGKKKVAAGYMQEAYYCYARWGAKAKVADLEIRYPVLLAPILRSQNTSEDIFNTLMTISTPTMTVHDGSFHQASGHQASGHQASGTSFNQTLDFASVLQASQALSGIIEIDELLCQLTQIMLQNSGGDRCVLILPNKADEWQVRAITTDQETTLHTVSLHHHPNLPVKLLQYVKNTQEVVVFDQLKTELPVIDHYLQDCQPKSVLCLPILTQSRCIGILFLENRLTEGVFTQERILVLNFLCAQAAISIENARLFVETREVEASWRESEEKLKKTANSLPGLVYQFRLDAEGNASYPYLSDRATELLEFDRHTLEHSAEAMIQCIEPEDLPAFKLATTQSMKNLTPFIWTGCLALPSGRIKWIEARSTPKLQEDGSCLWDGVMLDVSERKVAENAMRASESKFRTLLSNLDGVVYRCQMDDVWTMIFMSDAMMALSGYPASDFIGNQACTTYASIIHPDDIELVDEAVARGLDSRQTFTMEYRIIHKNGSVLWVTEKGKGIFDDAGELQCLEGVILDISDRKVAEAALAESESYHRNLFDQASIGLLLCRMNGDLVYANQAFADILGRKKEDLSALTYWEITPHKYAEAEKLQIESLNTTGRYGPYEKEYLHKDGYLIPVRLSGVIVERDNEKLIWSSIEDISDRKRAEETVLQKSRDLEAALAELQNAQLKMVQSEKMSALGGLVAGVAHEINNPVGCIIGNVGATKSYIEDLLHLIDLYAEQLPNPDEALEEELEDIDLDYVKEDLPKLIQAMKDSGERIKSISKSLRTFSRADTETKQVFDLREGLESTVLILRHRLKGNDQRPGIEVVTEYGDIPAVACFPGQLNQVFMNILANAIDALDEASQGFSFDELKANPKAITIRTELETGLESQQVKIVISDNGPGIPDEVKAKIFDHLFTTKGVGQGTGLGLAIARQIVVESHGGMLEVQSEAGQGTSLCICLPI